MSPKELIKSWVLAFNTADFNQLAEFYHEDAVNHQVNSEPINGKDAIRKMFEDEFAKAEMKCLIENIFEDGEWGILEWKDPLGLRGCGFFHIVNNKIKMQRGYWDKLSFLKIHKLPMPDK